jgi:hypothetical protein
LNRGSNAHGISVQRLVHRRFASRGWSA